MYHSPIGGKPSLRVVLVMGLLMGLSSLLLLAACGGGNSAKGGAGQEHNKSTSGGSASTAGLIAFRRYLDLDLTQSAIFTMYPNGTHIHQITHPPKGWSDSYPAWSPDGTKVAFNRQAIDESTSRIMVLNLQTGDARQVVGAKGMEGSDPAFSPSGHSLAFSSRSSGISSGIWVVWSRDVSESFVGSGSDHVTYVEKRGALEFEDSGPAFSPGGTMLVFERTRLEDDQTAVFVQPIDSSSQDARQITPWKMNCGDGPEFSPNGDWVLFSCEGEGGYSELYWVHPNGTGLEQLTNPPFGPSNHRDDVHYVGSSFSPEFLGYIPGEGNYVPNDIVAARWPAYGDEGNSDVFRMHIEGVVVPSVTGNLTKSETLDDDPSWGTHQPAG